MYIAGAGIVLMKLQITTACKQGAVVVVFENPSNNTEYLNDTALIHPGTCQTCMLSKISAERSPPLNLTFVFNAGAMRLQKTLQFTSLGGMTPFSFTHKFVGGTIIGAHVVSSS